MVLVCFVQTIKVFFVIHKEINCPLEQVTLEVKKKKTFLDVSKLAKLSSHDVLFSFYFSALHDRN